MTGKRFSKGRPSKDLLTNDKDIEFKPSGVVARRLKMCHLAFIFVLL